MMALAETEKGTKEEGGRRQKGQAPWSRYEDVPGGGLLANHETENKLLGYIQGSEPNVATGYRVYSLLAPGQELKLLILYTCNIHSRNLINIS